MGPVRIAPATVLAPMAGVTDTVFRRLIRNQGGCGLMMTEFTSSHGIVNSKGARRPTFAMRYLAFEPNERPISAQLFGADPEVMADAASICQDMGFDIVDINFGCPVNKVVKCNGGSGLLRDLPLVETILHNGSRGHHDSVNVKFRAGWNDHELVSVQMAQTGGELRAAGGSAAPANSRAGLQRKGGLDADRRSESCGQDSGDRQWRHPHAGRRRPHDRADRVRRGDDRPRGFIESLDLRADPGVSGDGQLRDSIATASATS